MRARIVCLPGDGVGPEVMYEAVRVLTSVACAFSHSFTFVEEKIGGASITAYGAPLTQETVDACQKADALLLGAVGGPRWHIFAQEKRPETGLQLLLEELNLYAGLRFISVPAALAAISPFRPSLATGANLLLVSDASSALKQEEQEEDGEIVSDTFAMTASHAQRLTRLAFRLARERRRPLCIVDMPGLPATGRLFEKAALKTAKDHPSVSYRRLSADRFIEEWMHNPAQFSAALCGPLAGAAVSGAAAALMGGRGMLPGAFLGDEKPILYQPAHGPESEIAGKDTANPIGMILCAAMMLRLSLNLANEAECVETAVNNVLEAGWRTADLSQSGQPRVGTEAIGKLIAEQVDTVGAVMGAK